MASVEPWTPCPDQILSSSGRPRCVRAEPGGADDAGGVTHRRRHERGARLEEPPVLRELLGHAAAEDDEVRPQVGLVEGQEFVELAAPPPFEMRLQLPADQPAGMAKFGWDIQGGADPNANAQLDVQTSEG